MVVNAVKNKTINRRVIMSDFTQFVATTPIVEPATSEVIYDKYWLSNFRIMAGESTKPVRLVASFSPARDVTVDDGEGGTITYKELKPNTEPSRLVIEDLFGEAAADPTGLGTVMNNVLAYLKDRAVAEGVI